MEELIQQIKNDPYAKYLGIEFEKISKGYALCSLTVVKDMLNFMNSIHGGLIFSLADAAFSAASNYDQSPSFALDVSGSFLKTANIGDKIVAEAKLIHTTKRTGLYRMEVYKNQELLATFNGTVFRKI